MRPREPLSSPPRPLLPEERRFIRSAADAGDPSKLIAGYTGRKEAEIRQVLEARGRDG